MVKLMFLFWLLFGGSDNPPEPPPTPVSKKPLKRKKDKGQGLIEFALVILLLMVAALSGIDILFRYANQTLGQYYAYQAAREASIYLNYGTVSCDAWVRSHMSEPILIMGDTWSLTLTGCSTDSSWSQVSGSPVSATFTWHQQMVWYSEAGFPGNLLANGTVVMHDVFQ